MVTVAKPNFLPVTESDNTNGAAINFATCTSPSPGTAAILNGSVGIYDIFVQKSSATSDLTSKRYGLSFYCENSSHQEGGFAEVVAVMGLD